MVLTLVCITVSAVAQRTDKGALLRQADRLAAEGKLVEARLTYEEALAAGANIEGDYARLRSLGLCYMNGMPADLNRAAKWLAGALAVNHDAHETRLALAQALSWNRRYDQAIAEYRQLLTSPLASLEMRAELARVLSWARRYNDSLAVYDELIAASGDDAYRVERARVMSWARRYAEAMRAYDEILERKPDNVDALIGKAQVLYWSGRPDRAIPIARGILAKDPQNPAANFLMASLEYNLGMNGSALSRLRLAADDTDTRDLRDRIRRDLRPVLHLGFGMDDSREEPRDGAASTYRAMRYIAALDFNVTPSVRMSVSNTVTTANTSTPVLYAFGKDGLATQTMARVSFSPSNWLRMSAGAGVGTTGRAVVQGVEQDRQNHFLYDVHPVITVSGVRIDFSAYRAVADYTTLSLTSSVVQDRQTVVASYTLKNRVRFGGEYWHGRYGVKFPEPSGDTRSLTTDAHGGAVSLSPLLYQSEKVDFSAGVRYELFEFADRTVQILDPVSGPGASGVFMPRVYQRYSGTAYLFWAMQKHLRLELGGSYGPQRVFGFRELDPPAASFENTGSFFSLLTVTGWRLQPYIGYSYFSTATPGSPGLRDGSYSSHAASFGLRLRF